MKLIENGYLRVGIVAHSEQKSEEILESFQGLKFQSLEIIKDFATAKEEIKAGRIQWVFSSFKDNKDQSVDTLLDEIYLELNMIPVVVSALLSPNEVRHLPVLFSKGLFTWHPDKGVSEYTRQSLWRLKRKISQIEGIGSLIPYIFLRSYLKEKSMWQDMISLCQEMTKYFPYEDIVKVHLAEAYLCIGEQSKARPLLNEMESLDHGLASQVEELKRSIRNKGETEQPDSLAKRYGLSQAIIVHSQPSQRKVLADVLRNFGFETIHSCSRGEEAWSIITREKIDLLILDWEADGLSASNLLQRTRMCGYWDFPILIQSSQLRPRETQLLKQYGVSACIPKVGNSLLQKMALSWIIVQSKEPTEAQGLERKIIERLGKRDISRARRYFEKFLRVASRDPAKEKLLMAQIELVQGNFLDAKYLLLEARSESKISLVKVDTMMAQCMFGLNDFAGALSILKRMEKYAFNMIEVEALSSRCHLRLGDIDSAFKVIKKAAMIDCDHPWVLRTLGKLFALNEDMTQLKALVPKININRLIRDCVNLAIAYCQTDAFMNQGIRLLKVCSDLSVEYSADMKDIIELNLAVAYIKANQLDLANRHFEEIVIVEQSFQENYDRLGNYLLSSGERDPNLGFFNIEQHASFHDSQIEEGQPTIINLIDAGSQADGDHLCFLRGIYRSDAA